ncbi:retinoid-inducible serine carboxypeptidase-like isoform X1 [Photinus pyralis]|uniref:retinoid-inducible serine carboxypeptidase-like isoform X2 n=1 Tax=Photinus pyralis TaxID=7054 RepID=UPI0012672B46|nr:retinoid-inducible serine carboxypeptidase-like isoform X2 [Photinus pyralis]XP_031338750.1 retinoid-inducible serine carboxypeptidase-like isoform X1 [Photinus pyralis]
MCEEEKPVNSVKGVGGTEQAWGHVTVRPHAHMFWWLYYTTANVSHFTERPLIIWLQGGPGMPSSGYGNFLEIGLLNINLTEKDHSWVKHFNILFLDNPVGVGFSYFSSSSVKMVQNNKEIGRDLINFLKTFLSEHEEFQKIPLYIFGESYGGKMAVEFAYQLVQEIRRGEVTVHFKGIGLGDAYISPIHYILNYGSLALNLGLIEKKDFNEISNLTEDVKVAIERRDFLAASDIEAKITDTVIKATQGIDVYNIVLKSNISALPRFLSYQDSCNQLMNTKIKESLNISADIEWNFINDDIYSALQGDLMRPVTGTIEALLNETDIKIIVYNGVFDFLVNTAGTAMWLDDLKWNRSSEWQETNKQPLEIDMVNEAYVKQVGNLVFYTVLRAGHSVPVDNIPAMEEILKRELLYS